MLRAAVLSSLLLIGSALSAGAEPTRIASVAVPSTGQGVPGASGVSAALRDRLTSREALGFGDRAAREAALTFYEARGFTLAWTENGVWLPSARAVLDRLARAREDGFDPADYQPPSLRAFDGATPGSDEVARIEADLTIAVAQYIRHAAQGRSDIARLAPFVHAQPQDIDVPLVLAQVAEATQPERVLDGLHPVHPQFLALRAELQRVLASRSEPAADGARGPTIPVGAPILRLGVSDPRVPLVRERLGLAAAAPGRETVVDAAFVAGVRGFQERSGLEVTGTVGPATIRALNGQFQAVGDDGDRIAAILVNMERWRWLPRDLGDTHVWVSVPEYMIRVVRDGDVRHSTRAVVGKRETPTPVFTGSMNHFVVNPSWTVPPGIARRDMFPLLASDPEALARRGIQVIRTGGRTVFRQPPGERNALGRIKFMFPNPHAIYLHDTPARGYFQRQVRLFSNGCVRVDNPLAFAEAVFAQEVNVTAQRIQSMVGGAERAVRLRHVVPVHLTYFTAEIGADGELIRRADPYGLDQRMRQMLGI